jgi:hypothetical protein
MARQRDTDGSTPHAGRVEEVLRRSENKTHITLSGLGLTEVPTELRQATKLISLDLRGNRFNELPEWLDALPSLEQIDARGNPLRQVRPGRASMHLGLEALGNLPDDLPYERLRVLHTQHASRRDPALVEITRQAAADLAPEHRHRRAIGRGRQASGHAARAAGLAHRDPLLHRLA